MRVLVAHTFYRNPGGEDRYVRQQVSLLSTRHDVRLLSRTNVNLKQSIRTAARMTFSARERSAVDRAIDTFRPDVIHLHNPYPSFGPVVHLAAAAHGIPLVVTAHNFRLRCPNGLMFTEGGPCRRCEDGAYANAILHHCFVARSQSLAYASALWMHRFVFRLEQMVDVFIAPSRFMSERLERWGIAPDRVALVRNYTDIEPGSAEPGTSGMYLGRLSKEKGVDVLLRALRAAGDPPFRIVGDGPAAGSLRALAAELRLHNTVFTGLVERDQVVRELRDARFVAFPSSWDENAPLAALEAMAAGRPLLVTRVGGLNELVEEGAGLSCAVGDVAAIGHAIGVLMGDDHLCRLAGARGVARARAEFSPARHLERLEEVYRAIVVPARSTVTHAG
jgi:glycosyltransferase involved in cell wall biosynthesis